MDKSNESGVTLLELIVAMIVATIAAGLILSAYTIVVQVWHNYNRNVEASGSTWTAYTKIEHLISQAYSMRKTGINQWMVYKENQDSCLMKYNEKSLFSSDSSVLAVSGIDSFDLNIIDASGFSPVWECGLVYSQGKKRSIMVWRTICRGNYSGTDLPQPFMIMPEQMPLYWEGKGK
jgi:hypothetical protein